MRFKSLALIVLCTALLVIAGGAVAQDGNPSAALAFVAEKYGVSADDLSVIYQFDTTELPMGKVNYYKIVSPAADGRYTVVIDESGKAWTQEEFRQATDDAYLAKYGKMDVQLYQRFEQDPSALIPVEIWLGLDDSLFGDLRGPDYVGAGLSLNGNPPPRDIQGDRVIANAVQSDAVPEVPESVLAARQAIDEHVVAVQAEVGARLAQQGIAVEARPGAPILAGALSREQVVLVGQDPAVSWIYAGDVQNQDMNSTAIGSHRAVAVWGRGYTGVDAKVALLEDSRADTNPWLYNYMEARVPADPNVDSHATQTMGNIGSSHGNQLGMARGASLYSANATTYNNVDLQAAADWAIGTKVVHILNNSWGPGTPTGCMDVMGRFFDYKIITNGVLVTHSAGNSGALMGDQAMAFNILSVGSYDDRNNPGWSDDSMSSFSAWDEGTTCSPSNGDRQEPDVVAVGDRIRSTRMPPPYIDNSNVQGTSYSSPMVAGEAALMIDHTPSLMWKPEAMRALIMANAIHNIEGATAKSEYDGTGGIDAYSAYIAINNGYWSQQTIDPTTWTSYDYTFYGSAGEPVACVATWTSHPPAGFATDPLLSDLDLALINPGGTTVATSSSVSNNWEIVRATLGQTGTWICRVYKWSSTATWEYLGVGLSINFQADWDYPD